MPDTATRELQAMLDRLDRRGSKPSRIELLRLVNQFRLSAVERETAHLDAATKFKSWQADTFEIIVCAVSCLEEGQADRAREMLTRIVDLKNMAAVAEASGVSGRA